MLCAMRASPALCVGIILFALRSLALADPQPMTAGASPAPTDSAEIAMVEEQLAITMDVRSAAVRAEITLENRGPATALEVGFPCALGDAAGAIDVPCTTAIAIRVDGKRVAAKKRKQSAKLANWVWLLKLGEKARTKLVVSYQAPLRNDRYSVPAAGLGAFTYRLTTGARWAGPIGKLIITVDHLHEGLLFVAPAGYQRSPGRLTWTLTDHEPTEEVILMPHPMAGMDLARALGALEPKRRGKKSATEYLRARVESGDFTRAEIEAVAARLREHGSSFGEDWLPMIARFAGVPAPAPERAKAVLEESIRLLDEVTARAKR